MFCPKCGTQLQQATQEAKQTVWKLGMPCPNCGGTQLKGKFCAYCNTQLIVDMPEGNVECVRLQDVDLNDYFVRYNPNRINAIKALRKDTGIGLIEAKKLIDQIFDDRSGKIHDKDLSVAGQNLKDTIRSLMRNGKQ